MITCINEDNESVVLVSLSVFMSPALKALEAVKGIMSK